MTSDIYTVFVPYHDTHQFLSSISHVKKFPYIGIFDHDFRYTYITWSDETPKYTTPSRDIFTQKKTTPYISHIVILPYHQQKSIYIPTKGSILLNHQTRTASITGTQEFHAAFVDIKSNHRTSLLFPEIKQQNIPIPRQEKAQYMERIRYLLQEIKEGNLYQCNLSWRTPFFTITHSLETYIRLRSTNPSRFGCWIKNKDHSYISNSPEQFLHIKPKKDQILIQSTPIKGTRSTNLAWKNREELWFCTKEIAELTMIDDMVRNDFGRFCIPGTIIPSHRKIRRCGDLYHAEQIIRGIGEATSLETILKATFPAASITGTPKLTAQKYISQLETYPRELYTGSLGWIQSSGETHLNVAIRTIEVFDDTGFFHVGCGIVSDSDPTKEWEESIAKSLAIMKALGKIWI